MKYCAVLCVCILSLAFLLSCGLEEFYYIDYIPPGIYNDTNAVINLPSSGADGYASYFDNFIIFYRLYISPSLVQTGRQLEGYGTNSDRTTINATLNSDYNGLYTYTDTLNTSVNTSNLENTFCNNRRYCLLTLKDANINGVLDSGSLGRSVNIAFPPDENPTLTVNGVPYVLQRAVENESTSPPLNFRPLPGRDFLNNQELLNIANVTNDANADVATNSTTDTLWYTYVSMYIAARGTSLEMPPRTIYSQPTFIGIFRLAESGNIN